MNESKLKRLLDLFQQSEIEELEVEHSFWRGWRVRISRARPGSQPVQSPGAVPHASGHFPQPVPGESGPDDTADSSGASAGPVVVSPMVGTFYAASSPDADPFVARGDKIHLGQTVCIIEAMKIMNEIHAEVEGEVEEILVADGDPVEYNQPLIQLRSC